MPDRNAEAKRYNKIRIRLKFLDIIFVIAYLLIFQFLASSPLKGVVFSHTYNMYYAFFLYLLVFSLAHYIIEFPIHIYSGFLLERKFNLSNQTFFNWMKDDIKRGILSFAIFVIFIQVFYIFLRQFAATWWIWIAVFWFFATVLIAKITPVFIIPLFFKYYPVADELKKRIIGLSKKCNIKILDVYKIDFSKKTNKLNAAVVGLGNTRRVILADTLIRDFTEEEIEGVLAHEFAHHKLKHMWKLISFGIVSIFISFYILYLVSLRLVSFFGAESISDVKIFPVLMLVLFIVSFFLSPLQSAFSRKLERESDLFALRVTQNKDAFISLMKKLAEKNLADPNPPKIVEFLFYDHPPISKRIKLAEEFK